MKRLIFALVALAAFAQGEAVAGGDPAAKALLEGLYKPYTDGQSLEPLPDKPAADIEADEDAKNARFYTPELAGLMARDRKESGERGEVGRLDFDPLTNSQDWEPTPVDIAVEDASADKARGSATFTLFNKTNIVRFDLVKTNAGWRIDDIRWNDVKDGLKALLNKPMQ